VFDLPRHADVNKVAWHLINRRGAPSSKEGREPSPTIRANLDSSVLTQEGSFYSGASRHSFL
jgi:hypothetical protein